MRRISASTFVTTLGQHPRFLHSQLSLFSVKRTAGEALLMMPWMVVSSLPKRVKRRSVLDSNFMTGPGSAWPRILNFHNATSFSSQLKLGTQRYIFLVSSGFSTSEMYWTARTDQHSQRALQFSEKMVASLRLFALGTSFFRKDVQCFVFPGSRLRVLLKWWLSVAPRVALSQTMRSGSTFTQLSTFLKFKRPLPLIPVCVGSNNCDLSVARVCLSLCCPALYVPAASPSSFS
mmetsp:Transcript_2578/g.4993  ORF Transcript_2578/g.4993 Transcript_2578/m.4993 type:complete len:233 (-) Transcript_2578:295-993(-)